MRAAFLVTGFTLVGVLSAACGTSTDTEAEPDVDLRTDGSTYSWNDTAVLTLTNHGPARIGPRDVLGCILYIERAVEDGWERVGRPEGGGCILLVRWLEPGEEARRSIRSRSLISRKPVRTGS